MERNMSIATEITALNTNLTAAKNAVTAKGGTVGDTGLAGLATEIASIPSGGGGLTDWGVVSFYSIFGESYDINADQCTVNSVDRDRLELFLAVQEDPSMIEFSYGPVYDPGTGQPTGEYVWRYGWGGDVSIAPEDMAATTGIDVTVDDGATYAQISMSKEVTVDTTSPIISLVLDEAGYTGLGNSDYSDDFFHVDSFDIARKAIVGFVFGTNPTSTPSWLLSGCTNLTSIDLDPAASITTIGNHFLYGCTSFDQQFDLPSGLTSIGDMFLGQATIFNRPLTIPSSVTSIGSGFLKDCEVFNQPLTLPNITTINGSFLENCRAFNQPLTIPSSVTSIGNNFLQFNLVFNRPLVVPDTVTSIGDYFLSGCAVFNSSLTLPSGLTSIPSQFLRGCTVFNQSLTIPSGVTSIGDSFLENCRAFNQPLALPSGLTTIGNNFLAACSGFNQPLVLPSSITSIDGFFMLRCNNMTSIIDVGSLPATVCTGTYVNRNFSMSDRTALAYTNGMNLRGATASAWKAKFPDITSGTWLRKLNVVS
jgi:hypothetical protein